MSLREINILEEEGQQPKILQEPIKLKRVRISDEISGDVAEWIKNAVYLTPDKTMARFIADSLAKAIKELEKKKERNSLRENEDLLVADL